MVSFGNFNFRVSVTLQTSRPLVYSSGREVCKVSLSSLIRFVVVSDVRSSGGVRLTSVRTDVK
jgi:hypothetical protein